MFDRAYLVGFNLIFVLFCKELGHGNLHIFSKIIILLIKFKKFKTITFNANETIAIAIESPRTMPNMRTDGTVGLGILKFKKDFK